MRGVDAFSALNVSYLYRTAEAMWIAVISVLIDQKRYAEMKV